MEPYKAAWKAIVSNFGRDILLPSDEIDREKLGKIVFGDEAKRKILNQCTHPAIFKSIFWKLVKYFISGKEDNTSICSIKSSTMWQGVKSC